MELKPTQKDMLVISSYNCEYCEALLEKYKNGNSFDLAELSLRESIHIETTTRRKDVVNKVMELFKNHGSR